MTRGHCRTCTCPPLARYEVTLYPPNETLYGRCPACGEVRHSAEIQDTHRAVVNDSYQGERVLHCGCCKHEHTMKPGGYDLARLPRELSVAAPSTEDGKA